MKHIPILHPGEHIKDELYIREWTQRDLCFILGCSKHSLYGIASGKRGISCKMSKALGKAFGVSPEFFINLQKSYDLSRAPDPDPEIESRAMIKRCQGRVMHAYKPLIKEWP